MDKVIRQKGLENCFISEISIFELKFGAANSINPKESQRAVELFISGLKVIPIISCANKYAEVKTVLKRNGTPMHDEFDLIIGVTALENKLTLVTDNVKDFRFIDGLLIENWVNRN